MLISGRRTASGAVAGAIAIALAGCGNSGHATVSTPTKATIAEVCEQHQTAAAVVVGGIVEYKTYMTSEDPAFQLAFEKSGVARKVKLAIETLEKASGSVALASAGQGFFKDLDLLEGWLKKPVAVPSAVIGERNASKIERAARAVGCPL